MYYRKKDGSIVIKEGIDPISKKLSKQETEKNGYETIQALVYYKVPHQTDWKVGETGFFKKDDFIQIEDPNGN